MAPIYKEADFPADYREAQVRQIMDAIYKLRSIAGEPLPQDSRFAAFWKGAEKLHFTDAAFDVLQVVEESSAEKGCTAYQLALAWCAHQPGVTSPITGPRTLQHLEDSLAALRVELTAEDLERIDAVAPPGRATIPYYGYDGLAWVTWGPHKFHW